ncbi:MAG: HAD family hydrolase [Phycisphaerae bacterium]
MKYKAVLFDLDGTLADSVGDLTTTMNQALSSFGKPAISRDYCRRLLGTGLRHFCEHSLPESDRHLTDELMSRFQVLYRKNCHNETVPFPGMAELVKELGARGVKIAVVTNKNEDISTEIVESLFGAGTFSVIRGAHNGIGCKPQPEPTLGVLEILGVTTEEALFVGDGEADVEVARNCGIKSVWVSWGLRSLEELGGLLPDIIVHSAEEILAITEA